MIENIPSRYLLKRFKYSLVWLWMNLSDSQTVSVSWSTCYVVHSNPSEPKLIISNLMNESTYQLGSFNWHEDCWFKLHLVLTMLKHICWDISYKKIVWFINKAYLPVYKWSRFFLQTGPPEVVQEVLADLFLLLLQMIIQRISPLANDHPEGLASCKWSFGRGLPLANDHLEGQAPCKWSSGGSGIL